MTTYTKEPVVPEIVRDILKTNWDNYGGKIPQPTLVEVNIPEEAQMRYNFQGRDYIFIQPDITGEKATPRDTFRYWDLTFNITLTIYTAQSRQRLYDIKKEIRRIFIYKMHDTTVNQYQLLRYGSFTEHPQEALKIWKGQVRISFESVGVNFNVESP